MFIKEALEIISSIPQGKEFLNKYPDNEVILKSSIPLSDINRICKEYPDFLPISKEELKSNQNLTVHSITVIAKKIMQAGYPKFRIYVRGENKEIIRVLISE
jgi:hypothetical protein